MKTYKRRRAAKPTYPTTLEVDVWQPVNAKVLIPGHFHHFGNCCCKLFIRASLRSRQHYFFQINIIVMSPTFRSHSYYKTPVFYLFSVYQLCLTRTTLRTRPMSLLHSSSGIVKIDSWPCWDCVGAFRLGQSTRTWRTISFSQ